MRDLGRRRSRYDEDGPTRATVALFVGAIVLLLASGGLIAAMLREGMAVQAASPTPGGTTVLAVATPSPTDVPATNTPPPPTAVPATATGTATARPATATAPASARPASPTPRAATTRLGNCALAIPPGFAEERAGSGYYPANDKTGFVALDPFATNGGQRSTADLAQGYVDGTLKLVLVDVRQIASILTDDSSRIEYTASAGGKAGRGVVVVRRIGDIACGVTLFTLTDSPIAFDQTLDYLLSSLQLARP